MLADDSRPGEEKEKLLTLHLQDLVVFFGDNVDVVAPEDDKLSNSSHQIRRWCIRRKSFEIPCAAAVLVMTFLFCGDVLFPIVEVLIPDDPAKRRLHRTSRYFERLQQVGANTDRHDNR